MKGVMAKLDALDVQRCRLKRVINLAIYRDQIEVRIAQIEFREYEKPLNADTTFWTSVASYGAESNFRNETQARALDLAPQRCATLFR
jgi:uncharacterized protein (DUF885 family)